jgi:AcrR family transcriptional regulator
MARMPTAPAKGRPKRLRRDPKDAKALILQAAVRVLSERGPDAVGLKEVAQEAGVSHALVTHYFGSYEALVDATIQDCTRQIREKMLSRAASLTELTPYNLISAYLEIALEPWYAKLITLVILARRDRAAVHAGLLAPDMKLITQAIQKFAKSPREGGPSLRQIEATIVAGWALGVGYAAGRDFFWNAMGREWTPQRDRDVKDIVMLVVGLFTKK